jgi:hypothetical protein
VDANALNVISALGGALISQVFNYLGNKRELDALKIEVTQLRAEVEDWKNKYFALLEKFESRQGE